MSDYTPDTESVREQYTGEQPRPVGTVSSRGAEFDRWLEAERRAVWDECSHAWDQYCIRVREYNEGEAVFPDAPNNPYRKGGDQ